MHIAFISGQHSKLAKGAFTALQWYCAHDKKDLSWSDKKGADGADMIVFYTEEPEEDIWNNQYMILKCKKPVFYLLGNFHDPEDHMKIKTTIRSRIGFEQIAIIHYNMLLCEAFYRGKINEFMKAAREGNCYVNNVFYADVSRAVFALQKYKEIYNG